MTLILETQLQPQILLQLLLNGDVNLPRDNKKLQLGASQDLQIYHNGSNSYIDNGTGNLYFRGSNGQMLFRPNNNEDALVLKPNGAVELYYDNDKVFFTETRGVRIGDATKIYENSTHNTAVIQKHRYSPLHNIERIK